MEHLFVKTAFPPEELSDLQLLLDDITSQAWFDPYDGANVLQQRYGRVARARQTPRKNRGNRPGSYLL
ncbi:hypothetical protein J2Y63_006658 [Shinella sp. BE166]